MTINKVRKRVMHSVDFELIGKIKRTAVTAVVSDDRLMQALTLKGGNAIELGHNLGSRASLDIDFSCENDLSQVIPEGIRERFVELLKRAFEAIGMEVLDLRVEERPPEMSPELASFWGGYEIAFKVVKKELIQNGVFDAQSVRRKAEPIGAGYEKNIFIDVSKHEFVGERQSVIIDGYTVYVYSPVMIVLEKLRSICQQMEEYAPIVKRSGGTRRPRPKDFYDIHVLTQRFPIDLFDSDSLRLLRNVFDAKRVPLALIHKIVDYRNFHTSDYQSLVDTVIHTDKLKPFDFYFDFVVDIAQKLKSLGIE